MRSALAAIAVLSASACSDSASMTMTPDAGRATMLSQAGLYSDFAARIPASDLVEFAPAYALWSDGAMKRRWLRLPPGTSIDKTDPDHWQFPVGTQLWKEFSLDGVLLETRLIERTGEGDMDFWMGAFVWKPDASDAIFAPNGAENINGTDHDAPAANLCWSCHGGEPGRILGYSAVQLGGTAPGSPATAAALGYLHANCGHCHNEHGIARPDTDQMLRLSVSETTPEDTAIYRTTIGVPLNYFRDPVLTLRIAPGLPDESGVYVRLSVRGSNRQMPPLATEHVDETGAALVRDWILDLGQ